MDTESAGQYLEKLWMEERLTFNITPSSKKVMKMAEWLEKQMNVKIRKEDMNKLVMDFLVTKGYVEVAEIFHKESGTESDIDLATITDLVAVKKAVQSGDIDDAIEKLNELNPEILDTDQQLFFSLQQQRLIEQVRNGKVDQCLEYAKEPRGDDNTLLKLGSQRRFLNKLETFGLLALEASEDPEGPVGRELLDISKRLEAASKVNAAILTSLGHEKDPKLFTMLKMLTLAGFWIQKLIKFE